jgi:hypothetical protein
VPVLATPVGIHAEAVGGLEGCLCAPFDIPHWRATLEAHLTPLSGTRPLQPNDIASAPTARVQARARAMRFSSQRMAERVAQAWRAALERRR